MTSMAASARLQSILSLVAEGRSIRAHAAICPFRNSPQSKMRGSCSSGREERALGGSELNSSDRNMPDLNPSEVVLLTVALARDYSTAKPSGDRAWIRAPAVRVIDCVLSLNRRYDGFVVPRLDRFESAHPSVMAVRALRVLVDAHASPAEFMRSVLDYRDDARAQTVSGVIDFVLSILSDSPADAEIPRLEAWARAAVPDDYKHLGISGFGLAGFQYLRMLFGANTTKPDVHIVGYVREAIGRSVSNIDALRLLERAAGEAHIRIRDADTGIWEARARSTKGAHASMPAASESARPLRSECPRQETNSDGEPGMSNNKVLVGRVRDIQPNDKQRCWEVVFDPAEYGADFPATHGSSVHIEWPSGTFSCVVGIKPKNPIYLRTPATSVNGGAKTRVTDLCSKHGLGRAGPIHMEVVVPRQKYRVVL
jgi:hypothetical protein